VELALPRRIWALNVQSRSTPWYDQPADLVELQVRRAGGLAHDPRLPEMALTRAAHRGATHLSPLVVAQVEANRVSMKPRTGGVYVPIPAPNARHVALPPKLSVVRRLPRWARPVTPGQARS